MMSLPEQVGFATQSGGHTGRRGKALGMETRLAFGIHAVRKALANGRVEHVYLQENLGGERYDRLAEELARHSVPVTLSAATHLQRLTGTAKHQGVAAVIRAVGSLSEREARAFLASLDVPLLLVLDGVQDPRNFGALLRTADAAGVGLVVTARNRNVSVTPVVTKVASGAAETVALAQVGNLARFLGYVADAGIRIVGTDAEAEISLFDANLSGPVAIVLGSEAEGMRRLTREHCDLIVRLPMRGVVESLNVAVAAGICLYECQRQRGRLAPVSALR
jgi:23S rRNA (guanosine2251-2'-O)-methyltransferase